MRVTNLGDFAPNLTLAAERREADASAASTTDLDYVAGEDAAVRAVLAELEAGGRAVLVTIVGVEGASPRPVGAQMAVRADGSWVGYISGGCLESAVAQEALKALETGAADVVRYGKGSKYFDIVLPCGSGVDLHFDPAPDARALAETVGDTWRHRMPHGPRWNRANMLGQAVLALALVVLVLRVTSWV